MKRALFLVISVLFLFSPAIATAQDYTDEQRKNADDFSIDFLTKVAFHEIGHLFVYEFGLPVLGKGEDAADSLAALVLLEQGTEEADYALKNAAAGYFMWAAADGQDTELDDSTLMDVHSLDKQRAFALVCLMVGNDAEFYADTAKEYALDDSQQQTCASTYQETKAAWDTLLEPHLLGGQPPVGKISISYQDAPGFEHAEQLLKDNQFLEKAAAVVSEKYLLPRDLTFEAKQCDTENAYYSQDEASVTICYELVDFFIKLDLDTMVTQ